MEVEGRMEELVVLAEVPGILELLAPECGPEIGCFSCSLRKSWSDGKIK